MGGRLGGDASAAALILGVRWCASAWFWADWSACAVKWAVGVLLLLAGALEALGSFVCSELACFT